MNKLVRCSVLCLWCCVGGGFVFSSDALAQPADAAKQRQEEIQQSRDKLKSISLALAKNLPKEFVKMAYAAGYSDQDGKLILSWRVAILPALGEEELWKQFQLDHPWDSEHNRKLIPKMPDVFKAVRGESKEGHTYYRGFAGEDAMFPLKSPTAEKVPAGDRSYFPVYCRPFGKLLDGTSNTFLIAEGGETVPWTKPEELTYDSKQPLPKLGGQFDGDFVVMNGDGTTRLMTRLSPEPALRAAITAARGENIQFKAAAESGFTIEFVTPEMEERMYALGRFAEKSPHASMAQITDGTNETAFAGIVAEGRAVPWTKPDDLIFDDTFQTKENAFVEGAIMFANGSVRYMHLQEGLDRKQFRALFTIDGKEPSPLTSLYPPGHTLIQPTYATVQETVRHSEARSQNLKNLRHMGLAFHNYQDSTKSLPPAIVYGPDGKPWHSWRVVMLPYLGYGALYQEYDGTVPWDHPKNAAVLNKMPAVFRDPLSDKADSNKTRYLLVAGVGTAFPTKSAGNVVAQAPTPPNPAQPAPPKPVAKDGRQPIEYQPFNPAPWKAKNQSTWLFPWEGERVVLLTTTADLDAKTMAAFVKRLDAAWKLCGELVAQSPNLNKQHNGKVTIAAVPDLSFTLSFGNKFGFGFYGSGGIEVAEFYGPQGDFERVRKDPDQFPDHYFYLIGQNHSVALDRMSFAVNGSALLLRHIGMEGVKSTDSETQARQSVVRYENAFAQSKATFAESFIHFGAKTPLPLNDLDGKPFAAGDLSLLFASCLLKVRQDNGGDEWVKRFYRHLSECPPVVARQANEMASVANGQLLNWVVAASLAAGKDLSPQFRDRWRFPLAPEVWQSLQTVDWKKPGLTADNVFDALPSEHLLPSVAMARPGFLTPERRKQNLLVGGTFEDGSGGTWTVGSFRRNAAAAAVEGGVAKEGQKAVVIRAPIDDDARYLQKVAVKPNTRYLVSGWIKTKDVVVVEPTGRTGANLSIDAHTYELSQSVVGTNDWRYASFLFDSGTRTEVLVCARIGFVYSTAKGEAWFDDLCLIPIGVSPVRPTAPVPAATITTNKDWKGWSKDTPPPAIAPFNAEQAKQHQEAWAKHLKVPVEYTNSIGMKFRLIPPGEFMMGSTAAEIEEALKFATGYHSWHRDPIRSEAPQHKVVLSQPIYMGTREVTQGDYEKVMGWNPSHYSSKGRSKMAIADMATTNHPVETVTWNDAAEFCAILSQHEKLKPFYSRTGSTISPLDGNGYRLPTEAEWEFACRAGTVTKYWSGDKDEDLAKVGWVAGNAADRTHAAAELRANPFGLYDMHGNAWEWVQDGWDATTYNQLQAKPAIDPSCPFSGSSRRVVRSGGFVHAASFGRSANRGAIEPLTLASDRGFRAILRVEAVKAVLTNPVKAEAEPNERAQLGEAMTRPEFLTPERKKQNMLMGGTFENGVDRQWERWSWRRSDMAWSIDTATFKEGQKAAVFRNPINDWADLKQRISVKPNTRYLVSGWIKTKNVVIAEAGGQTGASLSLDSEHTRQLIGTNDWTYVAIVFSSGPRTTVTVGVRLGFDKSPASGEAWFDDLCLIPVNPNDATPAAPAQSTPNNEPPATNTTWKGWPQDAPRPAIAPFDAEQAKQHQEVWAKHLGVPVEYTNSIGMKFVLIPPGEYRRGNTAEEITAGLKGTNGDYWARFIHSAGPQHKVVLTQPFYLGTVEVTQGKCSQVTGRNPAHFAPTSSGSAAVAGMDSTNFPVERMSWQDSIDFCQKLSEREKLQPCYSRVGNQVLLQTGSGYRLPTDAEWEYACRAGTDSTFWFGSSHEQFSKFVHYYEDKKVGRTYAVGELKANPFGLFDMHGNVWEFVQDGWHPTTYSRFANGSVVDPIGAPSLSDQRPIRGGSWLDVPSTSTSGTRMAVSANDRSLNNVGFRVLLSIAAVKAALANPAKAEAEPEDNQNAASTWKGWPKDAPPPAVAPFNAEQAKQHQEAWAKHLGVPVEYTNSIGMKFRLIPPGEFMMGSTADEVAAGLKAVEPTFWLDCVRSESPRHKVVLTQPVYFGIHEVTQANYKTVMGTNPAFHAATGRAPHLVKRVAGMDTNQFPVEGMTWYDSVEFCAKLSLKEKTAPAYLRREMIVTFLNGAGYRLPTEAEWEFACRAGTTTMFSTGDSEQQLAAAAWTVNNSGFRTHAVGELSANPFGLHDMHGNVWERLQDWWGPTSYTQFKDKSVNDPTGPMDDGVYRVSRGGSLFRTPAYARSAFRSYVAPTTENDTIGFRVTLSVAAVKAALANPVKAEAEPEDNQNAASTWKGWPKDAPAPAIAPFNAEQAKQHQEAWAKHLGVPVEFTNSIGMKFVLITPGEFLMGSTTAEIEVSLKTVLPKDKETADEWVKSEGPQHKVILTQPYYLGAHEITQQDYESVTGTNPSIFSKNGPQPAFRTNFDTSKMPVENVTWSDFADFCTKLSVKEKLKPRYSRTGANVTPAEGNGYRLPTEAEWEFACRAGTTTRVWFAKDEDLPQSVWLANPAGGRPYPVGQLKPNPFGLYDIYGNACEFVEDGWSLDAYKQFASKPAINPSVPFVGAPDRVLRGVIHPQTVTAVRSSRRSPEPVWNRRHYFGARAALSVEAMKLALANPVKAEAEPDQDQNAASAWKAWPKDAPPPAIAPFNAEQAKQHQEAWAKHLSVPVEFTNSIGMKFVLVPPGEFLMGNTSERIEAELKTAGSDPAFQASMRSQIPQHRVILTQPIYLGAHEVTQGHFESVIGTKPSHFAATGAGRAAVNGLETTQHPVDSVSWNDAAEFCAKLSERERLKPFDFQSRAVATQQRDSGYRLPTEAEWERACRAGTVTTFWPGNTYNELLPAGWFGTNSKTRTHAVGELRANPFGLHDVHGNVWEWVHDAFEVNYYQTFEREPALDPIGPAPANPRRGLRGGGWQYTSRDLWASFRHSEPPTLRYRSVGFRVALSVAAVKTALTNPVQIANANARQKEAEGDKHREQKEYAQAIACYREVIQHEPNNAAMLNRLAWVLAVSPQKDQPAGEALKFAQRAIQQQPSNPLYRNSLGAAQYRAGQYAEALSNLAVVVEAPPKNFAWLMHNLLFQALCHERLGDRATAQTVYLAALELLKQPSGDSSRVHEARLLQSEIAELGVLERVPELFTLKGHTNLVLSVAFSPDGKIIASGSADRTLKLWDAASGQELRTLKGDLSTVTRNAFSPDSKTLAAPGLKGDSGPGDVTLWDVATGTKKGTWKGHLNQVWAVAFSPDGKQLASSSIDGMVKLWDAAKGQEIRSWQAHSDYVLWVAFSPDGKRLATGAEGRDGKYLKMWDITTGQEQLVLKGHTATNGGVAFSPDGKRVVSGSSDKTVKLWDSSSGQELRTLNGHTGQVGGVLFSPDGKWIASACYDGTAKLWDAATGHEIRTLRSQRGGVSSVAISPDGKRLVTGNSDQTVRVWDISGVKPIPVRSGNPPSNPQPTIKPVTINGAPVSLTLQSPACGFSSVAFSADGQQLVTSSLDQTVRVWDSVIGEEKLSLKGGSCATLSRDGKWLASGGSDKVLRVWDASNGQEKLALKGHTDNISGVAFSLDGQRVASASDDQTVKIWEVASGKESLTLKGHSDAVRCVAFSPDGKRLASAGRDQIVKLWDATSGEEQLALSGHKAAITSIAFSPDGTSLASASHDQSVKLWNLPNGKVIRTLEGHDSGVMSVSFSADGKRLVSASGDQTVRMWDSATGQPLLTLKGHASQVVGAALSPDGNRIASASFDRTAKVWELAAIPKKSSQPWKTLEAVRREYSHADKDYLAAARDSRSLINGDFGDGLKEWLTEGGAKDFQVVKQGTQATLTTAGPQQVADTGRLYQYFKVPDEAVELQFKLHGGADSEQTHVALWHGTELKHRVSGRNDNSSFQVSWNVMSLRGDIVSLEIVDHSLSDWGFIGVQGFKLVSQKAPVTPANDPKSKPLTVDPNQVPLTLKGHSQQVTDVAFNADGTRIATASQDGTVKLWDAVTGQVTHTLKSSASRLAFSPDGKRLATGGHENGVTLWDVSTGQIALRLSGLQPAILGVAFAPDGQRLAAGSADGTLKVWDITNGQERLTLKTPAWQVAFSPDGKQLASASHADSAVKVWDATNGQELFSLKLSQGGVNSLMFSPDGKRLATSGYPSGPTVWDLSTGQPVLTLKAAPWSIAFDPTGQWIATGHDDNGVLLSNAATGQTLATLKGNTQRGSCVAFSVDGKRLASASDDLTVKVWDLVPGASPPGSPPRKKPAAIPTLNAGDELLTLKGHGGDVESVVFSADGKRLVTASEDQTAKIWNATDGSELLTLKGHTGPVTCVAITADGKQVATGGRDHLAKLWDATTGRETHSLTAGTNYLTSVAFSPDGKRLASAAILAAKVWNTTTGQEAFDMQGHFANVNAIVFSPDEKRLASCSHDMTVKLRDATNGRETLTLKGHRDAVTGVAFSPDGKRVVSCSHDQTLKVWDTKTGSELLTLIGHTSYITGVAISTDGKRLASVSWDSTARLWDAESGQELLTVKGHSHRVNGVAFSPDGKRLATASDDRTVKLWDISLSSNDNKKSAASRPMPPKEAERPVTFSAETARVTQATQDDPLTVTLKGHAEAITSLAISPDGKWLASASSDGVVVWDVADRKPRFTLRAHARYAISSVAISPDGKRLAAGVEMVAKIWDAATGTELQSLAGNTGRVNGIAFSSDGQRIASATQDQTVTIWDSTNGKVIDSLKEKLQSFGAIAFSPDGQWMAVGTFSGDTTGKVRKATSLEESFGLYGHNLYIKSFAFSADGKRLVSASDDGSLKIWETQTGDDLLTLRDRRVPKSPAEAQAHHSNQMKGVALSPDGQRLVSAGSNGFVSVWDAATGQKLLSLEGHQGEVRSVVFSPDGMWVASAGADATVKVWILADRPTLPPDGTILKANVDPKKVEADLKALEGTWQITDYATSANQPLPPEVAASIKEQRVVFQGDVLTFASKGRSESMVIIIDPTQPLKAIDLSAFDQGDSFPSMLGVYSLAGDTLKLAMSSIEAGRPKDLKPGDGILSVMTLTRTKPSDVQPTDGFNFHTWRPASKNLQRMNVKAKLANRESIRVGQLDRGFGLPETIFRWGVIGLPPMTNDAGIPETMWKEIASISHIVVVTPAVNDAMLKQLSQHRGLIALHVTGAWSATASSTVELKNCPHLINIGLEGSPETVETVRKLTALGNLRDLSIYNATASKELLSAITQFKELESLNLPDAGVTDDLVEQIATLKNLKFLVLQQAKAADKDKPKLSDKGLRSLMSLKGLKWLDLQGHAFSAEAAADFKASLPNCQVLMTVTNPKTKIEF